MAIGHSEGRRRISRDRGDRRAPRQGHPIAEIVRDLGQVHREGVVVDDLQARDRVGLAACECVVALDHRVIRRIAPARDLLSRGGDAGESGPPDRACDIESRDLDLLERRCVVDATLEPKGPGELVSGDLGHRRGEIGVELGAAFLRRVPVVREERSKEAAAQDLGIDAKERYRMGVPDPRSRDHRAISAR